MFNHSLHSSEGFRIKDVARLTGLSPQVIRKWERRYRFFSPERTPNGYRSYHEDDLQLLLYICAQLDQGRSIGQLAQKGTLSLKEEMSQNPVEILGVPFKFRPLALRIIHAARMNNPTIVEEGILGIIQKLGMDQALFQVFFPMLRTVGDLWHKGEIGILGEQGITQTVRRYLIEVNRLNQPNTGPVATIACFPGDNHEIGALSAMRILHQKGWQTNYLGPNPTTELIHLACQKRQSKLVVLSCIVEPASEDMKELVNDLTRMILPLCPIIVGGKGATLFIDWFERRGIQFIGDIGGLAQLKLLNQNRRPSTLEPFLS